jgi:hypothetical protein
MARIGLREGGRGETEGKSNRVSAVVVGLGMMLGGPSGGYHLSRDHLLNYVMADSILH